MSVSIWQLLRFFLNRVNDIGGACKKKFNLAQWQSVAHCSRYRGARQIAIVVYRRFGSYVRS